MIAPRPVLLAVWFVHKALRRVSGGRLGTSKARGGKVGTLFLHSVGRKSGRPRTNGLFYLEEGSNLVVVASNAGSQAEPAWWLNLQARPDAEVELAARRHPVRARLATPEEADRLWPRLDKANPDFVDYRAHAARPISIVILEPR